MQSSQDTDLDFSQEIKAIEKKIELTKRKFIPILHPGKKFSFQGIQIALFLDYIERIFSDFQPLLGDRLFKEDAAIVGGPAILNGQHVMVLGQKR